jgi:acyl phosphate:glycerol-3-phosphate acyltransferase
MAYALTLLLAYLLGSIPTAYLVARRFTGRDIRRLGGGNVGGLNTFQAVGATAGALVVIIDMAKGALAVVFAWLYGLPPTVVMLAGFAAVIGHLWMPWLGFHGGRGVGASLGGLAALFLIYGHAPLLLIFLGFVGLPLLLTRNVALAMGLALFSLPFIVWFGSRNGAATLLAAVLFAVLGLKFLPTLWRSYQQNKGRGLMALVVAEGGIKKPASLRVRPGQPRIRP